MKLLIALFAILFVTNPAFSSQAVTAQVSVCFTPAEQCEGRIVEAIDGARSSMLRSEPQAEIRRRQSRYTEDVLINGLKVSGTFEGHSLDNLANGLGTRNEKPLDGKPE